MEHPALSFLINYLTEQHLQCILTDDDKLTLATLDMGLRNSILKRREDAGNQFSSVELEPDTIYHILDYYDCCYSFFKFPGEQQFLFIGPYLQHSVTDQDIHKLIDILQIPNELYGQLRDYYDMLPIIFEKQSLYSLLRNLYRTMFSVETPSLYFLDLKSVETREEYLIRHEFLVNDDPVLSMRVLEERYKIEDQLLDAVAHGNTAKALTYVDPISTAHFPARGGDEKRTFKNLMLSFNTLLRRKAYESGVHPFYIDAVSSNFARMIEQSVDPSQTRDIIPYMIRSYCNLVEKHSMASYSKPVQQVLVTIDASLTADLSLKRFANNLFLNPSYLSSLFKKEVGMTLTDYVNKSRIEYAKKLLKSTTLSIQEIAIQSGIPDIHYFTRLFRRELGISPREWRNR